MNGAGTAFSLGAASDVDGDNVMAEFAFIHPAAGTGVTVAPTLVPTCNPAGVYDPGLGFAVDQIGPCTQLDSVSRF